MKKLERLGEAKAPDGTLLTLYRHDGAYTIRIDGVELMSTRRHNSEDALATLVCESLQGLKAARVLIGGLGLGFTLKAALQTLESDARIDVAELVPEVVEWNKSPDYQLSAAALSNSRVKLQQIDVMKVIQKSPGSFDAIMLDVDNGAVPLTTRGNAALYKSGGIHFAVAALRPNGQIAYWSANDDNALETSMQQAGLKVQRHSVRAHATSGPYHTIYVGQV
ncbi:MAG: spermidine synthase, partial [Gemmatimonadaceae bacterium]